MPNDVSPQDAVAAQRLVDLKRTGRDVDEQVYALRGEFGHRVGELNRIVVIERVRFAPPGVFADVDSKFEILKRNRGDSIRRAEVTPLVEHVVVRQQQLMDGCLNLSAKQQTARIGDAAIGNIPVSRMPHEHTDSRIDFARQLLDNPVARCDKALTQQQVFRRVAADHELTAHDQLRAEWPRAYDPVSRQKGYFNGDQYDETKRPAAADIDPVARELQKPVLEQQTVLRANRILRIATWLGFAAFGLFAAWRTRTFTDFLVWSGASLLASYFFIITEIWPWYVNWALALGALAPGRLPARLAMMLSAGVLTLYLTLGWAGTRLAWAFPYRGVLAFLLPLLIFSALWFLRWRHPAPHVRTD